MSTLKQLSAIAVVAVIAVVAFAAPSQAQSNEQTMQQTNNGGTTRQRIAEARCTVAEAKIETRSTKINTAKDTHDKKFKGIINRLTSVTDKAKARGYDTTELTNAKKEAEAALATYKTAFDTYKASLTATKDLACADSDEDFSEALVKARADLTAVRTAGQALKKSITETVIPAIKDYVSWLKLQQPATETETTTRPTSEGTN